MNSLVEQGAENEVRCDKALEKDGALQMRENIRKKSRLRVVNTLLFDFLSLTHLYHLNPVSLIRQIV